MRSFGTLIQEAPAIGTPILSRAVEDRFADIVAYTAQQMPSVVVGDRYRITGTDIEVIALMRENGQVAAYASGDPRTPSLTWMSQRSFTDNVVHLGSADPEMARRAGLATLLAMVFDASLSQEIVTSAAALVDLLGIDEAYEYLDGLLDFEFAANEEGPWSLDTLLRDARLYQSEQAYIDEACARADDAEAAEAETPETSETATAGADTAVEPDESAHVG